MSELLAFLKPHLEPSVGLQHPCEWLSRVFIEQDDDMLEAAKASMGIYLKLSRLVYFQVILLTACQESRQRFYYCAGPIIYFPSLEGGKKKSLTSLWFPCKFQFLSFTQPCMKMRLLLSAHWKAWSARQAQGSRTRLGLEHTGSGLASPLRPLCDMEEVSTLVCIFL